jgi:4-azaleucine resistance transporter AzlC
MSNTLKVTALPQKSSVHPFETASPLKEFWAGGRDTFPLIVGAIPFGLIYGALAAASGLSFWAGLAMSSVVFAGSAQFIAVGLVTAGTGWPLIVLTTFVVNLRHALYSATLAPYLTRLPQRWQALMAFGLTDETFVVAVKRYHQADPSPYKRWYYLGSMLFMYTNWQICTVLGLTAGRLIPDASAWGLDFAMPVTFTGMVIPYLKNRPMVATVLVAGLTAVLTFNAPHKLGLILASVAGIAAGVAVEHLSRRGQP